jgi:phospholipase D1/2
VRESNHCKFFIDGENYFKEVKNEILKAKEQIFITDWWLSPEIYMERPASYHKENEEKYIHNRLDKLLLSKANEGVLIFILLYKEVEIAGLYNSSVYAKT